jgi:phosphatidylglycerophosphatase A
MTDVEPRKPRFALFVATVAGLGYLPKAPGTWGSIAGILLYLTISFLAPLAWLVGDSTRLGDSQIFLASLTIPLLATVSISLVGVWAGGKAANYLETKDPQVVVIDEVSGQCLTLLLAGSLPIFSKLVTGDAWSFSLHLPGRSVYAVTHVNWKYLLVGFILFRLFDIWKPFPARQAESLPGGWGIMADDWVAGIYAALGLWIARMLGL